MKVITTINYSLIKKEFNGEVHYTIKKIIYLY